jgi:uncharacterized RDD family membrane protein YckC
MSDQSAARVPTPAKPVQSAKSSSAKSSSAKSSSAKSSSAKSSSAKSSSAKSPRPAKPSDMLEPVHSEEGIIHAEWTAHLVLFLRVMAGLSLVKGLYHWTQVCGIGVSPEEGFEAHTVPWQTATIFFAVFDLVAAVGLWLAAAWGAVVWLTSVVSMAVVELFFPQVFGGSIWVVLIEMALLGAYLWLAIASSRERPG